MTAGTTRAFLAVFPPAPVVAEIARAVEALRRPGDGVGWVKEANVHYTLRFLGDLAPDRIEAARRAAERAATASRTFRIGLGARGVFPNAQRPRVLWLGANEGANALTGLARVLETALLSENFGRSDQPFAPHLTLGRVRDRADAAAIATRFLAAAFPSASFDVGALTLVRSTLDPAGAVYEPLARYALG